MANAVMTPIGTLCFPALFEAKANQQNPGQKPRYSCILLFDKIATETTQYKELRAAVQAAAGEKWGATKAADPQFMRSLRLPFRNSADKEYEGFDKGEVFIAPWTAGDKTRPGVVDLHGKDILVPGDVWAGQKARATVRAFAYETQGNKGVAFGLEHVQIVKADEPRVDGRRSAESAFSNADNSQLAALGIDPTAQAPQSSAGGDMPW